MSRPFVIALTGRSGCGKSTAARFLRAQGYPVLDADAAAREVTQPGAPELSQLAQAFGADILDEAGRLRRQLLAQRAFATREGTQTLTRITHPGIVRRLLDGVQRAREAGARLCFVDGAAIVGQAFEPYCDRIVVVRAPRQESIRRIAARDGITPQQAAQRLDAQTPEDALLRAAHYIITNDADEEALRRKVRGVLDALLTEGDA